MIKDERRYKGVDGNLEWRDKMDEPGQWIEVEDIPHPPKWLWKLGLWGVFFVGILLGIVLAR